MRYEVTTTIAEVTVYPDRALIQRRGRVDLSERGEHTLRVGGLPMSLQPDSLRATGSGPAGTRILGIEQEQEHHAAAPEEEQRRLREEIERLTRELALLTTRRTVLEEQRGWLRQLGEQAARSLAWGVARGTAKPEDAGALFTYTGEEAQRLDAAHIEVSRQQEELTRELNAKQREYEQLSSGRWPDRLAAIIRIEAPAVGAFAVELSYLAGGASWRPRYDARVNAATGQVRLTQQALITQRTGEEWADVSLALSTARPSVAVRLPDEPDPWYISVRQPAPPAPAPRAMRMHSMASAAGAAEGAADALTAAAPMALAAEFAPAKLAGAEVERSGTAQVYRLPGRNGIPADGAPHTVGLGEDALPSQLEYVAAPVIAEGAHLRAQATNATGRVLLPGELHVFQLGATGEEYVGATRLELTPEGADLTLYLGVDSNIAVKRELVERDTDKGILLQSGIRKVTIGYRVTLANHTGAPQRVILKDVLPVPQHERVKVKTLDFRPQPSARTRLEQLTWELRLAAGEERRIEWRFVVESPSDLDLTGLP
ncbi:MAG TPA: mucoidy inhibitor MuiA family protein [Ktedonobacterales bacterium]